MRGRIFEERPQKIARGVHFSLAVSGGEGGGTEKERVLDHLQMDTINSRRKKVARREVFLWYGPLILLES